MAPLQLFEVPANILSIERGDATLDKTIKNLSQSRQNETDYITMYTMMVHLEEAAQSQFLLQFNQKNIRLSYSGEHRVFRIKNDRSVSQLEQAVNESLVDCFTLKPCESPLYRNVSRHVIVMSGQIQGSNKDYIFIDIAEENFDYLLRNCDNKLYDITFHINRTPFQLQHNALAWVKQHKLFPALINDEKYGRNEPEYINLNEFNFSGKLAAALNEEQRTAAQNMVEATNFPLPYLLFGPAGTGKTRTLVAAIEEIVKSTNKYVLVCANSNAACDEITQRLLPVLKKNEIFRMYAKSYDRRKISEDIEPICNLMRGEFRFPSLKYLYQIRVLVCTLCTAGCLARAREDLNFSSRHFSYVFIDECASTHETVSLIPIAGLCTAPNQSVNASIILAGDPKQLDAVTKSRNASKLGFSTSLMEHLFNRPLYMRNPMTDRFNPKYITQLVKNYRSHPAILHIPNVLFYDNKLEAKASADITDWFIGNKLLPMKKFPIIFKSVNGICKQSEKDFSMFNTKEVDAVIDFIKKLLDNPDGKSITQADIGVVTPYKLQCKIIGRACRRNNFVDVTVGTAEVFQGQERPVMIVSTVRTGGILGFVKDPRRLNVVITRAKCLLIIVGDDRTLKLDPNWSKLINYCMENFSVVW